MTDVVVGALEVLAGVIGREQPKLKGVGGGGSIGSGSEGCTIVSGERSNSAAIGSSSRLRSSADISVSSWYFSSSCAVGLSLHRMVMMVKSMVCSMFIVLWRDSASRKRSLRLSRCLDIDEKLLDNFSIARVLDWVSSLV